MKHNFLTKFLFHKVTLIVAGLAALGIISVSILTKAALEPTAITSVTTDCNDPSHLVVAFDVPVVSALAPGMTVLSGASFIDIISLKVIDGKLSIYLTKPLASNLSYTMVVKAGGITDPKNSAELSYKFVPSCPPVSACTSWITLDTSNATYVSPIGNISFKPYMLFSDDPTIKFSFDKISWNATIDVSNLWLLSWKNIYVINETTMSTYTLYNVRFDKNASKVIFDIPVPCAPVCADTVTLDSVTPTYQLSIGEIKFDLKAMLFSPTLWFSLDKINWKLWEILLDTNPSTIYVSNDGGKTFITLSNVKTIKGVSVTFDIIKDCAPVCKDTATLDSTTPTYQLSIGKIEFDLNAKLLSPALSFSLDKINWKLWGIALDTNPSTIYVSNDGGKTFITLSNVKTIKGISVTFDIIKDCVVDECPNAPGKDEFFGCPSLLRVSVEENVNGTHTDTALETKIFDANAGSCAATIGTQPQNYPQIWKDCTAENSKNETISATVDGKKPQNLISELVGLGVTKGTKLVLVKSQASIDGSFGYMGFDLPDMIEGESRDVGFNVVPGQELNFVQTSIFTKDSKGFRQSLRRAQVIKGSELQVFQPEYSLRNGVEQVYPFMFISDSDRDVDVCLEVPEGYKIVEPGKCGQTFVSNETRVFEFVAVDVGSPKEFDATAKFKVKNPKGKVTNFDLKVKSVNPNAWKKK